MSSIKKWGTLESKHVGDFRIFNLRSDKRVSPRTGASHDFLVLECRDWVNVVAITAEGKLVMVEQYRHGSDSIELEIPGGVMDPGEQSPLEAGLRELREETGYEGTNARIIGKVLANPAILNNTMWTVLVENCQLLHKVDLDHGEDIATHLVDLKDIPGLVESGRIGHSLVVAAFYHLDSHLKTRRS